MDKGFFGSLFDFNHDGKLDFAERACDVMAFNELMKAAEKAEKGDEETETDSDDFFF